MIFDGLVSIIPLEQVSMELLVGRTALPKINKTVKDSPIIDDIIIATTVAQLVFSLFEIAIFKSFRYLRLKIKKNEFVNLKDLFT